jgi:murein DD-endopeptidase MepM/ murein hydrolase activator NlpD
VFHLLGHLAPSSWGVTNRPTVGEVFEAGQVIGHTAQTGTDGVGRAIPHVHWEVRVKPHDSPSTRAANTLPPRRWKAGGMSVRTLVESTGKVQSSSGWWLLLLLIALGRKR